jgi:hypothetical protein
MFLATCEPALDRDVGEVGRDQSRLVNGNSKTAGEEVLSVGYLSRHFKVGHVDAEGVEGQISQGWGLPSTHITRANLSKRHASREGTYIISMQVPTGHATRRVLTPAGRGHVMP